MSLTERTPLKINNLVQKFCKEIVSDPFPQFVKVEVWEKSEPVDCYNNVRKYCSEFGGEVVYGWMILIWPSVFIEAQFHAVWRDNSANLLDITDNVGHFEKILFLEDRNRIYEGKQVDNIRKALRNTTLINKYIGLNNLIFEIMNEGELAEKSGNEFLQEIKKDQQKYQSLQTALKEKIKIQSYLENPNKIGHNTPCLCGSGKKYKKCCG